MSTLVFEVGSVLLLPLVLGPDGIWLSVVVAEAFSFVLTVVLIWKLAPHYGLREARRSPVAMRPAPGSRHRRRP